MRNAYILAVRCCGAYILARRGSIAILLAMRYCSAHLLAMRYSGGDKTMIKQVIKRAPVLSYAHIRICVYMKFNICVQAEM